MISIHALLAESDGADFEHCGAPGISIHALLAESDQMTFVGAAATAISIHALLAESDGRAGRPPARLPGNFYPRSPCGERRPTMQRALGVFSISIHALLAESDWQLPPEQKAKKKFLSTLSLRRATRPAAPGHTSA